MMNDPNKTVFISYRRSASRHLARSIFMDLTQHGYDVFLDVNTIDSGAFDSIILNQIGARTHFVVLLSPTALERCVNEDDWLRREIYQAMQLGRNIVPIIEEEFNIESEIKYLPLEWRDQFRRYNGVRLLHDYFEEGMTRLRERFLNPPQFPVVLRPVSVQEQHEVQQRIEQVKTDIYQKPMQQSQIIIPPKPKITLPQPFDWCYIPAGQTTLTPNAYDKDIYVTHDKTVEVPAFWMAKYPITNAQFRAFIDDGGYQNETWWTRGGLKKIQAEGWTQPAQWESSRWTGDDYPVVGVSWYEAVAFSIWLRHKSNYKISLPTDAQWQRAAQGDDGRAYPWGDDWNGDFCNNKVPPQNADRTMPVTHFEQVGQSPYGVVDLSGNVFEWCLTVYHNGKDDLDDTTSRIARGGSYYHDLANQFTTTFRSRNYPYRRYSFLGFRIACQID